MQDDTGNREDDKKSGRTRSGPEPERLVLDGKWEDRVADAVRKPKPETEPADKDTGKDSPPSRD